VSKSGSSERRAKEQAALIDRIEQRLAKRDGLVVELQTAVARCDELFVAITELGKEIDAAWGWHNADRLTLLLPGVAVARAIQHELYRIAGRAHPLGGQAAPELQSFPGARLTEFVATRKNADPAADASSAAGFGCVAGGAGHALNCAEMRAGSAANIIVRPVPGALMRAEARAHL
jgi:hypothetical protein